MNAPIRIRSLRSTTIVTWPSDSETNPFADSPIDSVNSTGSWPFFRASSTWSPTEAVSGSV
jgi:hypothetical protein